MAKACSVSVVIPNFNGRVLLEKNLSSVFKASRNGLNKINEIIVVDDGSSDDSVSFLKRNYPGVKVFKHQKNRGFVSAVNMGVRMAKGNLVALLNNDVEVESNFLEKALLHFNNSRVFAVSFHEIGYGWAKGEFKNGFISHLPGKESSNVHSSFWASGGSGLFKRETWIKLGGLDEELLSPFYWEDIDICYRAAKRGYSVLWEPEAKVIHHHASTVSKLPGGYVSLIQGRNQLLFIWKNLTSKAYMKKHISALVKRMAKHPGYVKVVLSALLKLGVVFKKRRKEQKESKISDEAIFASFNNK